MLALGLDLVAIAAAPWLADRSPDGRLAAFLDAFSRVAVTGVVAVHVLPHGLHEVGGWAVALIAVGFLVISALERNDRLADRGLGVIAAGLGVHQLLDGVALATPGDADGGLLALAVVAHTLPIAWLTWREARRRDPRLAIGVLTGMAVAVTAGFFLASSLPAEDSVASAVAEALVGGALLHLVSHPPSGVARATTASGIGALVGAAAIATIGLGHPIPAAHADELGPLTTAAALWFEAAPALLLGYAVGAIVQHLVPSDVLGRLGGLPRPAQAVLGALGGLPVPLCSCGALPVYEGLVRAGVPLATTVAFLVAAPEIGATAVLVSLPILGWRITLLRLGTAMVAALVAAAAMWDAPQPPRDAPRPLPRHPALSERFGELVDHTAPWILLGLGAAALVEPLLAPDALRAIPAALHPALMAIIGVPAYVCAAGATPLIAVLLHKGLSIGGAIALLITGPATNLTTFAALRRLHGDDAARRFAVAVVGVAVLAGWGVDQIATPDWARELHLTADHAHGWVERGAAAALSALFAWSLLRQGLSGFVDQVLHPIGAGDHHHHHHDGCDHTACDHGHGALAMRPDPAQAPVIRLDLDL
jgi:uncharacterized membrane protein YraQ (UPF0718 family)